MIALLAVGVISPFFLDATAEVRSTYQSLGKMVEDRPMQVTNIRFGYDAGEFGRFGVRNWDVSSLTDRRREAHRHEFYHTEFGAVWQYDIDLAEGWTLKSELNLSWTLYRRFDSRESNRTYRWLQLTQSVENRYVVPFWTMRKCFHGNDYFYFRAGLRRRFDLPFGTYLMPSVYADGGSSRNQKRVFGAKGGGMEWNEGASSVSARLEFGWRVNDAVSAFVFIEQYEVVGGDERRKNRSSSYRCAHNDWTHGGVGVRIRF